MKFTGSGLRILDFDCECRPLSYLGSDYTTGEITAIASAWIVNGKATRLECHALGEVTGEEMLRAFVERYNEADMVTGHFIRGFDLPLVNGGLLDHNLPPLSDKLAHDTKNDLRRRKYVSASQENLGFSLGTNAPKVQMNQQLWRDANRLTETGIARTKKRVIGDVRQHVQMRERLLELGWLDSPKVWHSGGTSSAAYVP